MVDLGGSWAAMLRHSPEPGRIARALLLDGVPPAEVAAAVGFYDQAHLTRHFRATLGITPGAYARHAA